MKKLSLLFVLAMVFTAVPAFAQLNCTPPPQPVICPEVKVTCPDVKVTCECPLTTECPNLEAVCQCDCGQIELPGLWEMSIKGSKICGVITVVGSGFMLNQAYFAINKLKLAKSVLSCGGGMDQ